MILPPDLLRQQKFRRSLNLKMCANRHEAIQAKIDLHENRATMEWEVTNQRLSTNNVQDILFSDAQFRILWTFLRPLPEIRINLTGWFWSEHKQENEIYNKQQKNTDSHRPPNEGIYFLNVALNKNIFGVPIFSLNKKLNRLGIPLILDQRFNRIARYDSGS